MAFSYHDFADARQYELPKSGTFVRNASNDKEKQGICEAIGKILFSAKDVLEDANQAFVTGEDDE